MSTQDAVRFWVRLPNWLGDVVMAMPVLRAIRAEHPDYEITLLGQKAFEPLIARFDVADRFLPLPPKGRGYFRFFYRLRREAPDRYLLFTRSLRGDLEAFLTRCPERLGMLRHGERRRFLTHTYPLPQDTDLKSVHQTKVWVNMLAAFGFGGSPDYRPVVTAGRERHAGRIGLIAGSENSPEKRWPVAQWRALITALLDEPSVTDIVLFGTPGDREITDEVAAGFDATRVRNRAGETNLAEFCDELAECAAVCCNDTGGMHLANMLGTPMVGVFGPTNPVRTGPAFDAPAVILQPAGCPATGGLPIEGVTVEHCLDAVRGLLPSS